jgi:hypothetical protein
VVPKRLLKIEKTPNTRGITTNPRPEEVPKAVLIIVEQKLNRHEIRKYAM